ncbi:MAG: MarC family protein [Verrucomicrobiota bacterium]
MNNHDQSLVAFVLLAASSLFVIMDPIALIPAFLAMTTGDPPAQRARMAALACGVAAGLLVFFALVGDKIFRLFGITLASFKIAGSIVLLLIGLDMLQARRSLVQETREEKDAGAAKEDIAITPLAVPMLAGPGAISTAILLRAQVKDWTQEVALLVCIVVVSFLCYLVLRLAARGVGWISPIAMRIATRIMGLLLVAVAVQFTLDALAEQKGKLF